MRSCACPVPNPRQTHTSSFLGPVERWLHAVAMPHSTLVQAAVRPHLAGQRDPRAPGRHHRSRQAVCSLHVPAPCASSTYTGVRSFCLALLLFEGMEQWTGLP